MCVFVSFLGVDLKFSRFKWICSNLDQAEPGLLYWLDIFFTPRDHIFVKNKLYILYLPDLSLMTIT